MIPYIIANWKQYLSPRQSVAAARAVGRMVGRSRKFRGAICPSMVALAGVRGELQASRLALGAQRFDLVATPASTGSVSVDDLRLLGCRYVLVGHSEQRAAGETDRTIARKLSALSGTGIIPILCVGEPLAARRRGKAAAFVRRQLTAVFSAWKGRTILCAYEPIWAITGHGAGKPCNPVEAFRMADTIREVLRGMRNSFNARLLYGGSVSSKTIAAYVDGRRFCGALVGHASTKPAEYVRMIQAVV